MRLFPQKGRARANPKSATKNPNGDLVAPKTLPFVLSAWGTELQLGAQSAIILAVLVLWGISLAKNGITSAPEVPASFFQDGAGTALLKARSVLWTWIPGLIMSLYSAFFGAMFDKLTSHQPIMELQQPAARQDTCTTCHAVHERHRKGWRRLVPSILLYGHRQTGPLKDKSTAGMTILLDYTEHWIPIANSIFAFRNRHHLAVRNDLLLKEKQRAATAATSPAGSVGGATTEVEEGEAGRDRDRRILEKSDLRGHAARTSALSGWECWLDDEKRTIRLRNPHIDHAGKNSGELSGFLEYSCEDMDAP